MADQTSTSGSMEVALDFSGWTYVLGVLVVEHAENQGIWGGVGDGNLDAGVIVQGYDFWSMRGAPSGHDVAVEVAGASLYGMADAGALDVVIVFNGSGYGSGGSGSLDVAVDHPEAAGGYGNVAAGTLEVAVDYEGTAALGYCQSGTTDLAVLMYGEGMRGAVGVGSMSVVVSQRGVGLFGNIGLGSTKVAIWQSSGVLRDQIGSGSLLVAVRGSGHGFPELTGSGSMFVVVEVAGSLLQTLEAALTFYMNLATRAVGGGTTRFNSYAIWNGEVYAADGNGVSKVGGAKDSGQNIEARLAKMGVNLGTHKMKRVTDAYLEASTAGSVQLGVGSESGSSSGVVVEDTLHAPHGVKFAVAKGVKGREMSFWVKNKDGSQLEIDEILLVIELLKTGARTRRG